jgi:hypothetical protein
MASSLWRYRWRHTWYGDRKIEIGGNWRSFAGPYYGAYFLNALAIGATIGWIGISGDFFPVGSVVIPGPIGLLLCIGCVLILAFTLALYRTRAASRILSTVSLGDAKLTLRIGTGALFGQFIAYVLAVVALLVVLALTALIAIGGIYAAAAAKGDAPDGEALVSMFQSGSLNVAVLIGIYLVVLGAFGMLAELILSFGWWRLIARGAEISNPDSLRSVRATAEDRAIVGQGLADALNVGAY